MNSPPALFKQGFAWWSFASNGDPGPELLEAAAAIGYRGVDFLPAEHWLAARSLGLELTIIDGHAPLEIGFNTRARHPELHDQVRRVIDTAAAHEVRLVAVASGDRGADSDADGLAACVEGLAPLADAAVAAGLVLLIEPLNSKVDHPGHECDRTEWAVKLVDEVGSPGLRVLYDFYHAQIMEGDLLRTVEQNFSRIGHFHTAGVPGRHELDEQQEINWGAVARLLHQKHYTGFVSHEFLPRGDPVQALRQAFQAFGVQTPLPSAPVAVTADGWFGARSTFSA